NGDRRLGELLPRTLRARRYSLTLAPLRFAALSCSGVCALRARLLSASLRGPRPPCRSRQRTLERKRDVADVEAEAPREPGAVVQLGPQTLAVARLHEVADELARLGAP